MERIPEIFSVGVVQCATSKVDNVSVDLLKKEAAAYSLQPPDRKRARLLHGVLLIKPDGTLTIQDPEVSFIFIL